MAGQIAERFDPDSIPASGGVINKTELGTRRQGAQGVLSIVTGTDPITKGIGIGLPNAPSVLTLDSTDATGVVTTNYLWVNRNGKLRISTTFPLNELSDGTTVGDQTGT